MQDQQLKYKIFFIVASNNAEESQIPSDIREKKPQESKTQVKSVEDSTATRLIRDKTIETTSQEKGEKIWLSQACIRLGETSKILILVRSKLSLRITKRGQKFRCSTGLLTI